MQKLFGVTTEGPVSAAFWDQKRGDAAAAARRFGLGMVAAHAAAGRVAAAAAMRAKGSAQPAAADAVMLIPGPDVHFPHVLERPAVVDVGYCERYFDIECRGAPAPVYDPDGPFQGLVPVSRAILIVQP